MINATTALSESTPAAAARAAGLDPPWDRAMLGMCAAALVLSFALEILPDGHGIRLGPIPVSSGGCLSKTLLGLDCPGCGLTRSFVSLAHGRWEESWRFHRVGGPFFAALLFQFPWRARRLWRQRPYAPPMRRLAGAGGWMLLAALVLNWVWNLALGTPPLP